MGISAHNPNFEAQMDSRPDGFYLTLTVSMFNSYWTSMPVKLEARNKEEAWVEASQQMIRLWTILTGPEQSGNDSVTDPHPVALPAGTE